MIINIIGEEPETEAFGIACRRILRWSKNAEAELHTMPRKADGWLEYLIVIKAPSPITIGMIQRGEGGGWEFHS